MLINAIVLVFIVIFALLIVRIGAVALRITGLDPDIASFQALSAFTGTGFTTTESDLVTKHPGRKRTVKALMIVGNVYFAAVVAMLISAAVTANIEDHAAWEFGLLILVVLAGTLFAIWFGLRKRFSRWLDHYIEKRLAKYGGYKVYQIQHVLDLAGGYTVAEFRVKRGSWLAGHTLMELGLARHNILVLAIERGLRLIRSPDGSTPIEENDNIVCYGPVDGLKLLEEGPPQAPGQAG